MDSRLSLLHPGNRFRLMFGMPLLPQDDGGDAEYGRQTSGGMWPDGGDRAVSFYEGKYYMLSNFSSFRVVYGSRIWPTAEHAYQAMKFYDYGTQELIRHQTSAHAAKKEARALAERVRPDWGDIKVGIMREICRAKMEQHPYVAESLEATGDAEIVEASPKDRFWGIGKDGGGENWLGRIWMELRSESRNKQSKS